MTVSRRGSCLQDKSFQGQDSWWELLSIPAYPGTEENRVILPPNPLATGRSERDTISLSANNHCSPQNAIATLVKF